MEGHTVDVGYVAAWFNTSVANITRRARQGTIPGAVKVDGRWRFGTDAILAAIELGQIKFGRGATQRLVVRFDEFRTIPYRIKRDGPIRGGKRKP